jgi:hypothetical protein
VDVVKLSRMSALTRALMMKGKAQGRICNGLPRIERISKKRDEKRLVIFGLLTLAIGGTKRQFPVFGLSRSRFACFGI